MIAADRELLARVAEVNLTVGQEVLALFGRLTEDGLLPAAGLRDMAAYLDTMVFLLRTRAAELEADDVVDAGMSDVRAIESA